MDYFNNLDNERRSWAKEIEDTVYELIGRPTCPEARTGWGIVKSHGEVYYQIRGRYGNSDGSGNQHGYRDEIKKMHRNSYFVYEKNDDYDPTYVIAKFKVSTPISEKIFDIVDRLEGTITRDMVDSFIKEIKDTWIEINDPGCVRDNYYSNYHGSDSD